MKKHLLFKSLTPKNLVPLLLLLLLAGVNAVNAQTATPKVVAAYGGFGASAAGSVSYTLGELATTTNGSVNGILTQGFQQPEPSGSVATNEPDLIDNLSLFPNPTAAEVTLSFSSIKSFSARWEIVSEDGRNVFRSEVIAVPAGDYLEKIDLAPLPAGAYFFLLKTERGATRTSRLVKL